MFVDELTIAAAAGNGGNGVERWKREPNRPKGGPSGGDGGNGGNVIIRAVRDLSILGKYVGLPSFNAEHGGHGQSRSRHGKNGEDLIIDVPKGTKVTNKKNGAEHMVMEEGDTAIILKGGNGGYGNEHFKSAENVTPTETTDGKRGESAELYFELELSADVGIIGFPNAGKSTLLNNLTNAQSRIGAYPFTTLEPHLGDLYGFLLADIPGLIEGASEGKGLGHKFLRHVKRTKMLLHCISLEEEDVYASYTTLRNELLTFDETLKEKEEWIVLTKSDLVTEEIIEEKKALFKDHDQVLVLSNEDATLIKELSDALTLALQQRV